MYVNILDSDFFLIPLNYQNDISNDILNDTPMLSCFVTLLTKIGLQ